MATKRLTDNLLLLGTAGAVVFLAFMAGSASVHFDGPFSAQLQRTFQTLEQVPVPLKEPENSWTIYSPKRVWTGARPSQPEDWDNPPAPETTPGVYVLDAAQVQPGLTLYTPVYTDFPIRLIDLQGNTVHQWVMPELGDVPRDDEIEFSRAPKPAPADMHLYPNGNLLTALSHDLGYQPYGMGLVMLDKDSNLLWSYMKQTHHQIDVSADGLIAAMVGKMVRGKDVGMIRSNRSYMDEEIVVLSADGKELAKASLLASIQNSAWQGIMRLINPDISNGDIFHLNAAKFLTAAQAASIPNAKSGDLLLSLRTLDLLAVLDPYAGTIVWAARGPWYRQHDPHVLANGNLMLFDNQGDLRRDSRSRVIEVNPRSNEIVWQWPNDDSYDLYTAINGAIEPLANGNVLIAETSKGRLLEVTREGELVWQYQIPERKTFWDYTVSKAWHPRRIDPAEFPFLQ